MADDKLEVDLGDLGVIAAGLDAGAARIESTAGSAPQSVDAGVMTGFVAELLAEVVTSAANVASALGAAAEATRAAHEYYLTSEADASAGFARIREVL